MAKADIITGNTTLRMIITKYHLTTLINQSKLINMGKDPFI